MRTRTRKRKMRKKKKKKKKTTRRRRKKWKKKAKKRLRNRGRHGEKKNLRGGQDKITVVVSSTLLCYHESSHRLNQFNQISLSINSADNMSLFSVVSLLVNHAAVHADC